MTFRIFSGDARKAIADHIIGAPPVIPNRHGANLGTDLLVQGGTKTKTEYVPDPGGEYVPDPGGDPTGGGTLPPTTGPGGTVQIDCRGGLPADNSGQCTWGIQPKEGAKFQWLRQTDTNGLAYCCPTKIENATDGEDAPPPTTGSAPKVCPGANVDKFATYPLAKSNTVSTLAPFNGKTPAQYQVEMKTACTAAGNSFNSIQFETQTGTSVMDACCSARWTQWDGSQVKFVYPPTVTPVTDPVPPIYDHDGETGGDTTLPDTASTTCHGPVIQDIAAGRYGYMTCGNDSSAVDDDCEKRLTKANTPAVFGSGGYAYPNACAGSLQSMMLVLNPSDATIAAGTIVVAVRNNTYADSDGTILFVPCST